MPELLLIDLSHLVPTIVQTSLRCIYESHYNPAGLAHKAVGKSVHRATLQTKSNRRCRCLARRLSLIGSKAQLSEGTSHPLKYLALLSGGS
jgi:hypothetical protein